MSLGCRWAAVVRRVVRKVAIVNEKRAWRCGCTTSSPWTAIATNLPVKVLPRLSRTPEVNDRTAGPAVSGAVVGEGAIMTVNVVSL